MNYSFSIILVLQEHNFFVLSAETLAAIDFEFKPWLAVYFPSWRNFSNCMFWTTVYSFLTRPISSVTFNARNQGHRLTFNTSTKISINSKGCFEKMCHSFCVLTKPVRCSSGFLTTTSYGKCPTICSKAWLICSCCTWQTYHTLFCEVHEDCHPALNLCLHTEN